MSILFLIDVGALDCSEHAMMKMLGASVPVFLQGICPGVELLVHGVCLASALQDNAKMFSKWSSQTLRLDEITVFRAKNTST